MNSMSKVIMHLMWVVCFSLLIYGCGGSGGGSTAVPATTVSGSVLAGPAAGSSVVVKTTAGTVVAGPVLTATDGSYSIDIPTSALGSDLVFEASGGTFNDEAVPSASGVAMGTLSALIKGGTLTAGANVSLDPSSTIISKLVAGGTVTAGMARTAAETAFNTAFGYVPDCSVRPVFATMSSASTVKQRLAGIRAAAFSQLTKDLGLTPDKQFGVIQALADDLSDGVLDGNKGGVPVTISGTTTLPSDIANRFVQALVTFQTSPLNRCRLTTDQVGVLPFNKTALTASYKVDYLPGATAPAQGKSSFRIRLTNRSDNSPAPGKAVTLNPYMFMATKSHTTPADPVVDNNDGTYSCTVYYVMSTMMNGVSMGVWQLKVNIGTESANFYPVVVMPMGTTTLAKLTGVTDSILMPAGPEKRTYFLFNDGLAAGAGGHSFGIFLATKESLTNFPSVKLSDQLKDQNGVFWTVSSIMVQMSTDRTNWIAATDNGNGHWSASGLTGLTAGVPGNIYVKLTVNSEQKTTDGSAVAAGGANGYQTFSVNP